MPNVAVVMPVFNGGEYLRDAIVSVLRERSADLEVVVVDDGSTDGSGEVAASFGTEVKVLRQNRRGVAAARNAGVRASDSPYVAFLDADDIWCDGKLRAQYAYLEGHGIAGLAYCGSQEVDEGLRVLRTNTPTRNLTLSDLLLFKNEPVCPSSIVARREVLDEIGGFDERLSTSADWDLLRKALEICEVACVPDAYVMYRLHGDAMHLNIPNMERDMLLALASAFAGHRDPDVAALRGMAYGNLFRILAGSYFRSSQWGQFVRCSVQSAMYYPPGTSYFVTYPCRTVRRIGFRPLPLVRRAP